MMRKNTHPDGSGGFPIGNFGICSQAGAGGVLHPCVKVNPSRPGPWLEEAGSGNLTVAMGDVSVETSGFQRRQTTRRFPFATSTLQDDRFPGLILEIKSFAPLAANDPFLSSLPVLLTEIEVQNTNSSDIEVGLFCSHWVPDNEARDVGRSGPFSLTGSLPHFAWGLDIPDETPVRIPAGEARTVRSVFAFHDQDGFYAESLPGVTDLVHYADENWAAIRARVEQFESLLPSLGDSQLDGYLRWYLPSGIYLTRLTSSFVITMGYCELNQRDSFWTSWPHLVFWPGLERRMLEESAGHMNADGKIPTTILPVIERSDDLDINCYFVLRVHRYFEFTRERAALRELWPAVVAAVRWLQSRDTDDDGLLEQQSFWADWKDVPGVEGRLHAPHFEFLWAAALNAAADMAAWLCDDSAEQQYRERFRRTLDAVNLPLDKGGLWNGRFYTSRWRDGRTDDHVQQDQLVGAFFRLIPPDRLESIYIAMEPSFTAWGPRETFPYRDPFNNTGGDYHNGGVWPFLAFMDAAGRFRHGFAADGLDIMRRVGHGDLEMFGDFTPHEYLCGESGENRGPIIQGWNADYYAAVVWGALGLEVLDERSIRLTPQIDGAFETPVVLPWGVLWLEQQGAEYALRWEGSGDLNVQLGWWTNEASGRRRRTIPSVDLAPGNRCLVAARA